MFSWTATTIVLLIALVGATCQSAIADDALMSRPDLVPACGAFPNPDFAPPFEAPIRDYMSFRWWFVHQPGAATVGRIDVPDDRLAWPYNGTDSIAFTGDGMRTFVQPIKDGTTVSAYYEKKSNVVGIYEHCDTASIYVVVRAKDVPVGLPIVDRVPQVTEKGVTLGMTIEQVKALLGPSDLYHTQHIDDFLLYRWKKSSDCRKCPPDRYAIRFDFENGQLIAMSYQVWLHPDIRWHSIGD